MNSHAGGGGTDLESLDEEGPAETFAAERIGELLILLAAKFDLTPEEGASILQMAVIENASLMDGPLDEPLAGDVTVYLEEASLALPGTQTAQ